MFQKEENKFSFFYEWKAYPLGSPSSKGHFNALILVQKKKWVADFLKNSKTLKFLALTVGPWADVKNGFTWKNIIVLKVRAGHGEWKFS